MNHKVFLFCQFLSTATVKDLMNLQRKSDLSVHWVVDFSRNSLDFWKIKEAYDMNPNFAGKKINYPTAIRLANFF